MQMLGKYFSQENPTQYFIQGRLLVNFPTKKLKCKLYYAANIIKQKKFYSFTVNLAKLFLTEWAHPA